MDTTKTIPVLTLIASLSAGMILVAGTESAFARRNNDRNGDHSNNNNSQFNNNSGNNNSRMNDNRNHDRDNDRMRNRDNDRGEKHSEKHMKKEKKTGGMNTAAGNDCPPDRCMPRMPAAGNNPPAGGNGKIPPNANPSPLGGTVNISNGVLNSRIPNAPANTAMNSAQGNSAQSSSVQASGNNGRTITISNGVSKVDIPHSPGGLMISSNSPGTITVFNGFEERTLRGGSVTLSGAGVTSGSVYTQITPGMQSLRNSQGDVVVAIGPSTSGNPAPSKPPVISGGNVTTGPGTITVGTLGKGAAQAAAATVVVPTTVAVVAHTTAIMAPIIGVLEDRPIQVTKEFVKESASVIKKVVKWLW